MDTQEIIKALDRLTEQSSKLDVGSEERTAMMSASIEYADSFIAGLKTVHGFSQKEPGDLSIHKQNKPWGELLKLYQDNVAETGINAASGTHLGYIPGGGVLAGALGDFIAAVTNPFAGVYYASPGAATIENEVINWLKTVFSFPDTAVGNLTSGGSVSNLIAFAAARDKHDIKNDLITRSVVYMSEQVHHSAQKALRIIGLEDVIIRYVPIDTQHRIRPDELDALIIRDYADGLTPFMVIGTAGTTDTGAIDPLDAIADIAQKHRLWYHIDGAYGGFFILTSRKAAFRGIERADSLIVDPHKSLFMPYGVGAVLIKDRDALLHSNYYPAHYMQDAIADELIQSPANLSPELTRHFRGLRVWLPLQYHGIEPFIACLEEKLLLTVYFRQRITALGFEVGPEPDLSVSYFRYPFDTDTDRRNKQLMDAIHHDGDVFLSSSVIGGKFVIRIAILAFRTRRDTIDRALSMIERCLKEII